MHLNRTITYHEVHMSTAELLFLEAVLTRMVRTTVIDEKEIVALTAILDDLRSIKQQYEDEH